MVEPLKITDDIKKEHEERIDKHVAEQNEYIQCARKRGQHSCCFKLWKDNPDYAEVRAIFERAGYHIKPTGYIGGVWQLTEDICW